ncbi:paired amphipathic helix protein Sin3a isoform X1 [Chironomus tepperi]|uniref:paired amphipathic helix protein Sin3a isoform X1 n=1 Tax=Chironomus tepperi TaxID=113505 RepID=UPI00391F0AE4
MKKRVDEIQNFHGTAAARSGVSSGATRILTPPQHGVQISPNTAQSQYQILNIREPTQSIQYTYTSAINSSNIQKNNISQQQPSQNPTVHTVSAGSVNITSTVRSKPTTSGNITPTLTSPTSTAANPAQNVGQNFPRLKVEDALSYLDQVKYKFGNQPQVYNDFLDIMKEFKSQSIDTPGVIQRVSNLFKGHPELIVGFNTFLPPGYKIEVQANDQGFAYQVSVSVPSPSSTGNTTIQTQHSPQTKFIQSTGHIIQQPPVNLITTHSQSIHIQPSSQQQQQQSQQEQRSAVQQNHLSTISTMSQNFSRAERTERQLPATSSTNIQSNTQPSTTTTTTPTPPQSNAQPQPAAAPACNESSGLHRIQPIFQNDNQPVQFNQAIVYVNKIKCRFQEQPEKYKHFLRILHKYQNEQRRKDNSGKGGSPLTETEVFKQVAHLFDNQEDLLREFGQFLPDASPTTTPNVLINKTPSSFSESSDKLNSSTLGAQNSNIKQIGNNISRNNIINTIEMFQGNNNDKDFHLGSFGNLAREKDANRNHMNTSNQKYGSINSSVSGLKRSPGSAGIQINHLNRSHDRGEPPIKRHKPVFRDVSYADASRSGTLQDYAFFDKVREALKSSDVYDNFLRCLTLFNQEIVSKSELMTLITPFLSKEPELLKRFQEFLKFSAAPEPIPLSVAQRQEHRTQTDTAAEIDVTQCKRLGTSYCALPKTSEAKKCSGRTPLCREVLNDTWVSFPSWSEDSTFNTSRKTQYEEFIYRCEDERFELDVVIETNSSTIRVLEGVQKKMSKMSADELGRFKLDDSLGGTSQTIHQRALRRIYGDKAPDIIEGLKKNPNVAVPVVLRRLKAKEEEWREAQKGFNQQWREQNEKYYLKSLDHQGINFKHADTKALRSKSLMNQIETAYEERNEGNNGEALPGPHLILHYKDKSILDDAANLLIHHVKRQTGIQKLEKARIKHILRQFVPELFFAPRQPLSDDEKEDVFPFSVDDNSKEGNDGKSNAKNTNNFVHIEKSNGNGSKTNCTDGSAEQNNKDCLNSNYCDRVLEAGDDIKVEIKTDPDAPPSLSSSVQPAFGSELLPLHANSKHPDEAYTLFFSNSNWYYFLRLHAILCDRLRTMYERTQILASEEEKHKTNRRESVAIALRLKPQNEFEIPDYYPAFLDMLKSLLDGNMDASTYEDKLRDMYGIHAYIAFTLDRVVSNAVRQLQFCVTERNALECFEIYQMESKNNATGGLCSTAYKRASAELAYQRRVESSLQEETYFKVFIYKIECRVTIEMLENDSEDTSANNFEQGQSTSKYIERYTNPSLGGDNARSSSRNNSINGTSFGISLEVKTEKNDHDLESSFRKPLFLKRNVRQFNKKLSAISENENGDSKNIAYSSTITSSSSSVVQITSTSNESSTTTVTSSLATSSSSILTTSSSSVPPPLIVSKVQETFGNNNRVAERIGQSNAFKEFFIDDQEQVKFNYQTYKTVFCNTTNKGYILYRYNSLKRSKQTHPNITKSMDQKFNAYLQKWLSKNSSELQRLTITDWLLGRNQSNFLPCKTIVKKDNNILETPYCTYNRYKVEHSSNINENLITK